MQGKPPFHEAIRASRRLDRLGEAELRKIHAVYLGMVSYADWLLGQLLDAVDRAGHSEDTAVIFCSDHGEWAGDYGLVEKWSSAMDDVLLRVPLIVRMPGGAKGHIVEEMVELHDVMATCLEIAGIEVQHTHFARSLVPQIQGQPSDPRGNAVSEAAFSEGGYGIHEPHCFEPLELFDPAHIYYPKVHLENTRPELISRTAMIRTPEFKLALRPEGESELYDLRADPLELYNVFEDSAYASQRESLLLRLLYWYVHTSDVVPWERDSRALPPCPAG